MPPELKNRLNGAALVFFDGTLWRDDEMIASGVGVKSGQRMGHMSCSGPDGVIATFAELDVGRKVLIHLNNTNPLLIDNSPECAEAKAAGWEVAYDGMELTVMTDAWSPAEFETRLRQIGEDRYHDKHPFHGLLHDGKLNKGQLQAWVA